MLRDIGLHSNVDDVYMYCNPAEHVFIIGEKGSKRKLGERPLGNIELKPKIVLSTETIDA